MLYINPYQLLNITSENLSEIDSKIILKEKRKLLHEIDLSDNGSITYNGIELTKSDSIKTIDELDDKDKREFHFFIYQKKYLNDFLSKGSLSFFDNYQSESIYKSQDFIDFISPYFANQYNKVLLDNFKVKNFKAVKKILSVSPLTTNTYIESCYKATYLFIKEIDAEINEITKEIELKESPYISNDFKGLDELINKKVSIELLNCLPAFFQASRNQIAQTIRNLARDINNIEIEKPDTDVSKSFLIPFHIIETATNISTEGLVKQTITKGFNTIKNNYNDDIKKKEQERQIQIHSATFVKYREALKQIEEVAKEIKEGKSSYVSNRFSGLTEWIKNIVNIAELNSLPSIFENIRTQIAIQIKRLSVIIWNDHNQLDTSLQIINLAGSIKADDDTISAIKDDEKALKEIENKRKLQGKPITSAPSLFNIYGIGTAIYGDTLYFIFLAIPIIPIARYNVSSNSSGGYTFYGKYNLHKWQKVWQYCALIGIALWILLANLPSSSKSNEDSALSYSTPPLNIDTTSSYIPHPNADTSSSISYTPPSTNNYPNESLPIFKKVEMKNGNIPQCSGFTQKYNYKLNNRLVITAMLSDAAVKLINYQTNKCIRYVFIKSGTTYTMRNIPEGKYYLKIAYGEDWSVKEGESLCYGRFVSNSIYKKGDEVLDYNIKYTNDGYEIPSFSLTLSTTFSFDKSDNFDANKISENEFFNN